MRQLAWTPREVAVGSGHTPAASTGLSILPRVTRFVDGWTPFGSVFPADNPAALYSYYLGMLTWVPVLGFLLGGEAAWLGLQGIAESRRLPGHPGGAHALTGILLGAASIAVHLAWFWAAINGLLA